MEVRFLSAKNYEDPDANNGDCILVDTGKELVIYDCGCEEHAKRAIDYMKQHGYTKAKLVLSHNDDDHFMGIDYLIDQGALSEVYTLLLFKYAEDLYAIIGDGRRSQDSIINRIKELYNNIYSLRGKVTLKDIFRDTAVAQNITISGPTKEYSLNAVAEAIKKDTSSQIDKETIVNAVSTQLSVNFSLGRKLLLTGDSSFAAIEDAVKSHNAIQLPHHGKLEQAESIFDVKDNRTIYYVSDNTGSSNGGSDDLMKTYFPGHVIHNTLNGDQICKSESFLVTASVGYYY